MMRGGGIGLLGEPGQYTLCRQSAMITVSQLPQVLSDHFLSKHNYNILSTLRWMAGSDHFLILIIAVHAECTNACTHNAQMHAHTKLIILNYYIR